MLRKLKLSRGFVTVTAFFVLLLVQVEIALADNWTIESEERPVKVSRITDGLNRPWSIAFVSATDWLVTERGGQLRRVIDGKLQAQPIKGLPEIKETGQGGLLDVAVHPDFAGTNRIYLSYAGKTGSSYGTEVLSATLRDNTLNDVKVIFQALPKSRGGRHFGSRLAFDNSNHLYISLGDRGDKKSAQNTQQHAGSIIRLRDDGSLPADNPFVNDSSVLDEIYSFGHRNVQGMVYDRANETLWAHEHGPQGGDELNRVEAGKNYGWPVITYGANYGTGTSIGEGFSRPGMEQPVTYWDPSIAPSGLALVTSDRYPEWQGNLLVGALKFQLIARQVIEAGKVVHEERLFRSQFGRIRDVRQGPDGFLYFLSDSKDGAIYRIE